MTLFLCAAGLLLAACGDSSLPTTSSSTSTSTATSEAATTEAAPPIYEGAAKALILPLREFPAAWGKGDNLLQTRLAGTDPNKVIFTDEKPWQRSKPISGGLSSVAQQRFELDDGLSSQATYNDVFVYESVEAAEAALPEMIGVLTSKKSANYKVSEVNPPKFLGEDAAAASGSLKPEDVEASFCLMVWRQANVIVVVDAIGLLKGPLKTCLLMSKRAHKATAEKVPA
jgi:hypothetical protein